MVRLPGGSFRAGDDRFYPEEGPVHDAEVGPMWVDEHPVTNAEFRRFVKATGHVTVAEHEPDPADFDGADEELLVPGSLVFTPTTGPVPLDDWTRWWQWVPGADWRHPAGPAAPWTGATGTRWCTSASRTRRPTPSGPASPARPRRSGSTPPGAGWTGATYAWGDDFTPRGKVMANTWHGRFPWENLRPHGSHRHRRGGKVPAQRLRPVRRRRQRLGVDGQPVDGRPLPDVDARAARRARPAAARPRQLLPQGRASCTEEDRRVTKGGSHLCAPSYCLRYRPAARQGHTVRSSTGHLGFRCIVRGEPDPPPCFTPSPSRLVPGG